MAATQLDLHVTTAAGYTVVEVAGEIDLSSAPGLRTCLQQTINAGGRRLVVDLRHVEFMDSMGIGVLVGAYRRLRELDGSLQLVAADGLVLRVLRLTSLDRLMPLHATLAAALGGEPTQAEDQSAHSEQHSEPEPT